jgi:ribosomal-protein-alanine N-acetyltransferase
MTRVIETQRLVLRPWHTADAEGALAIYTAPSVRRWIRTDDAAPTTVEEMRTRLRQWAPDDHESTDVHGHWAICDRATSAVLGALVLEHAMHTDSLALGLALAPAAWGNGYATEAGDALVRWAIHEEGALEVFAIVQPDNQRATATAERIGMEWVTELGRPPGGGRYQVYRIRHGDLDWED